MRESGANNKWKLCRVSMIIKPTPSRPLLPPTSIHHTASTGHSVGATASLCNRIPAVGQASRLSLTLNDRLMALFSKLVWPAPKGERTFPDGDRRDACPTLVTRRCPSRLTAWLRLRLPWRINHNSKTVQCKNRRQSSLAAVCNAVECGTESTSTQFAADQTKGRNNRSEEKRRRAAIGHTRRSRDVR
jgi:hypothetical protein